MIMKRNFLARFVDCIVKSHHNFFDTIFVTVSLFEIFNLIWYENNTAIDIILRKGFSKSFIYLKSG